mmetsp:Transcript_29890/g.56042  ORF Transcript_29890/g.56042 Transcript_29890/m.56042 type:complete len:620 (-) Transcript_29890:227-2086(-)
MKAFLAAMAMACMVAGEDAAQSRGNLRASSGYGTCQLSFDSSPGPDGGPNLQRCQGDCDTDADCADGLLCLQRTYGETVPGCSGFSWPAMDYCYDPHCGTPPTDAPTEPPSSSTEAPGTPALDSSRGPDGSANMPKCAGDCDEDSDCASGLRCFQRSGTTPVPGCSGDGTSDYDYCYDPADVPTQPPGNGPACLCVFDVDRTLTGKQGSATNGDCPANQEKYPIWDTAYWPGGYLTISEAGQNLQNTFCGQCYMGIVSAGMASGSGSQERTYLLENVLVGEPYKALLTTTPAAGYWSERRVDSPLVLGWEDRKKQDAVGAIVSWYSQHGVQMNDADVYFFGDRTENIPPFASTGYNAREISCASRDWGNNNGMVGYCGATTAEIVDAKGVQTCSEASSTTSTPVPLPPPVSSCVCIFDIDRTLTGRQGLVGDACPGNTQVDSPSIWDTAYGGGYLTLSDAAQKIPQTFCNDCYLGVVSAGDAGGEGHPERAYLLDNVLLSQPFSELRTKTSETSEWSDYVPGKQTIDSPLALRWPNRLKQDAAVYIVDWYGRQGITIPAEKVHFFGDRTENIGPFASKGFNAREISCGSRDYSLYPNGMVGLCGATASEIVDTPGIKQC